MPKRKYKEIILGIGSSICIEYLNKLGKQKVLDEIGKSST